MTQNHHTPPYWETACRTLQRRDPIMKQLIKTFGNDGILTSRGDPFYSMLRAITGQQISVKAADTVWARLETAAKKITPKHIARMDDTALRSVGLSQRKVEYTRTLQDYFMTRNDHAYWHKLDDDTVLAELVALRGVGRWTAEMFMMFCLLRPNILPVDDIGILKAIGKHYYNDIRPDKNALDVHRTLWHPWNTVASWYLWRALDPVVVLY